MKFLVNVVETYRIGTEKEATEFIEAAKHCPEFTLVKYSNERKERKEKSDVVDEWRRVTLWKSFNDEKEPEVEVTVDYEVR